MADVSASEPSLNIALLRYFNPGGAHISGEIGEDPTGIPNNLLPFVSQVAVGKREELVVFGGDYPTNDGTCIRDYIHVVDLAKGHLAAVEKLTENPGLIMCNLGTGTGYSVLDIINAFEKANDLKIPYRVGRGDERAIYPQATPTQLTRKRYLAGRPNFGIEEICRDAWHWQSKNPNGYDDRKISLSLYRRIVETKAQQHTKLHSNVTHEVIHDLYLLANALLFLLYRKTSMRHYSKWSEHRIAHASAGNLLAAESITIKSTRFKNDAFRRSIDVKERPNAFSAPRGFNGSPFQGSSNASKKENGGVRMRCPFLDFLIVT